NICKQIHPSPWSGIVILCHRNDISTCRTNLYFHVPLRPGGSRNLRLHSGFRDRRSGANALETANPQSTATPALSSGQMPSDTNDECNWVRILSDIGVL